MFWRYTLRIRVSVLACLVLFLTGRFGHAAQVDARSLPPGLGAENLAVDFTTENGWVYDGRIEIPRAESRNGWAVMILGGGLGSPIDWEVPGIMTLDGQPTRDADMIAKALLDAGFVVMRWQAIRRGDPLRAKDPLMMEPPTYPQSVEQARKAFAAFREKKAVADDHIFLLGHSLGARRAAALIEEYPAIAGLVMISGAQLIPSETGMVNARVAVAQVDFVKRDADKDGFLAGDELSVKGKESDSVKAKETDSAKGKETDSVKGKEIDSTKSKDGDSNAERAAWDINGDQRFDRHEWALYRLAGRVKEWRKEESGPDQQGFTWTSEVLTKHKTPTLAIVGALDKRWLVESYALTVHLRLTKHPDYTWRVFEDRGHNLAEETPVEVKHPELGVIANSHTGPIDPAVATFIVDWLKSRAK